MTYKDICKLVYSERREKNTCKRLRSYVLTRFQRFRTFAHGNVKNRLTWKQKKQQFLHLQQDCTNGHGCDTTR